jgi:hypothetical protein
MYLVDQAAVLSSDERHCGEPWPPMSQAVGQRRKREPKDYRFLPKPFHEVADTHLPTFPTQRICGCVTLRQNLGSIRIIGLGFMVTFCSKYERQERRYIDDVPFQVGKANWVDQYLYVLSWSPQTEKMIKSESSIKELFLTRLHHA